MPTLLNGGVQPTAGSTENHLSYDRHLRPLLRSQLESATAHQGDVCIVDELPVDGGIARVDLAVINGVLHGFEIKSERDTLHRLPQQVEHFSRVMDFVTLVVVDRFARSASKIVPPWWGLSIARRSEGGIVFDAIQDPQGNPAQDMTAFLEFLWRNEAYALLERAGLGNGVKSATKARLIQRLIANMPSSDLRSHVLQSLKAKARSGRAVQHTRCEDSCLPQPML